MTSVTYAGLDLEVQGAASQAAGEVVVEAVDDLDDAQGNPISSQHVNVNNSINQHYCSKPTLRQAGDCERHAQLC